MDWKDIAGTVGNFVGAIAPLLAGPVGIAASIGSQIAGALDVADSPKAVKAELQANPNAAIKLRQWAQEERQQIREHHLRLQELAFDMEKAKLTDTQDARAQHREHWMPSVLSLALFVLFSTLFAALFYFTIPEGNRDMVIFLTGQVAGFFSSSVVFWLGTGKQIQGGAQWKQATGK